MAPIHSMLTVWQKPLEAHAIAAHNPKGLEFLEDYEIASKPGGIAAKHLKILLNNESKAPAREWLVMSMLQSAALAVPSAAMPTRSRESWMVGAAVLVVGPAGQTFLNAAFRNL